MAGTLYTNGGLVALTPAELEAYDSIRVSLSDPGGLVSLTMTAPGRIDLAAELGSTPAEVQAAIGGGSDVVTGSGDDLLLGSTRSDTLSSGAGNDILSGGSGDDRLYGGSGDDEIRDSAGADALYGGSGNDLLDDTAGRLSQAGTGTLYGGAGNDLLIAAAGSVNGGAGIDWVTVRGLDLRAVTMTGVEGLATGLATVTGTTAQLESFQTIQAFADDATSGVRLVAVDGGRLDLASELGARAVSITLADAATTFIGGAGDDRVAAGTADDLVSGGAGRDAIAGDDGNDQLLGGDGDDALEGDDGADLLYGDAGDDLLEGGAGADALDGGAGADVMLGGAGDDRYSVDDIRDRVSEAAVAGVDDGGLDRVTASVDFAMGDFVEELVLTGSAVVGTGNALGNAITGSGADNVIDGRGGDDRLYGGDGADWISGGEGRDALVGGAGADSFAFTDSGATGADRIRAFSHAEGDRILIDDAAFAGLAGGPLAAAAFSSGGAVQADDRVIYDPATGRLWVDLDGSGAGIRVQIATLDAGTALTAADIWVI